MFLGNKTLFGGISMKKILNRKKKNHLNNEKGQGMVEYILLLVVIIGIVFMFKGKIKGWFESASNSAEGGVNQIIQ